MKKVLLFLGLMVFGLNGISQYDIFADSWSIHTTTPAPDSLCIIATWQVNGYPGAANFTLEPSSGMTISNDTIYVLFSYCKLSYGGVYPNTSTDTVCSGITIPPGDYKIALKGRTNEYNGATGQYLPCGTYDPAQTKTNSWYEYGTVTIIDCPGTPPTVNATATPSTGLCAGESSTVEATVTAGTNQPFTYEWSSEEATIASPNSASTDAELTLGLNTMKVVVTDSRTCKDSTTVDVTTACSLGITENANSSLSIFPNPVKDVLNLSTEKVIRNISIMNLTGQTVLNKSVQSQNKVSLNIENLPSGVYIINVEGKEFNSSSRLIIE